MKGLVKAFEGCAFFPEQEDKGNAKDATKYKWDKCIQILKERFSLQIIGFRKMGWLLSAPIFYYFLYSKIL